jgi:hypothetical protein
VRFAVLGKPESIFDRDGFAVITHFAKPSVRMRLPAMIAGLDMKVAAGAAEDAV